MARLLAATLAPAGGADGALAAAVDTGAGAGGVPVVEATLEGADGGGGCLGLHGAHPADRR